MITAMIELMTVGIIPMMNASCSPRINVEDADAFDVTAHRERQALR